MNMKKLQSGFTLIELLIVVAIIAILALIAVPNFLEAQTRAKVSRSRNDLRTMQFAMQANLVDRGTDALLVDFWDDDQPWGRDRIDNVFNGVGDRPEATRRQVDIIAPLTTPIAYVTSLPRDSFLPAMSYFVSGGHSEVAGREGNESYLYMDNEKGDDRNRTGDYNLIGVNNGNLPGTIRPLRQGEWLWIGYGPVLAPRFGDQAGIRQGWAYDPTNGTVSVGCIFRRGTDEEK